MPKNIGIDLGTTNSCVSYVEGKEPEIIPTPEGSRVIPSIVAIKKDGTRIFGNIAKRQMITNSKNTIFAVKRLIGRKYDSAEVKEMKKRIGYELTPAENGDVKVIMRGESYSPEEISGMLLSYIHQISADYLGEEIRDVVITVPAFFNDAQRQATKVAGEIARLNVTRIINEPTAALIAYRNKIVKDGLYAVYDLGGGTFDISIVEVIGDIYKDVSTLGDTFLGGNDFDLQIINWIFNEIEKEINIDLRDDKNIIQRISQIAEKTKIELSFNQEAMISIPYLYQLKDGTNYHFQKKLTRVELEHLTFGLIERTIELINYALKDINIKPDKIERTILVGGQSRMPIISKKITELFGKEPFKDLNPEEVVAQGAAIQSEIIKGKVKDLLLLDVTPLSLGVETKGDVFTKIIERNSTIPIKKSMTFTTIADNQRTVKIHVLQGEREVASENKSLGYFNLIGIPLAPKGIPQIEVTFEIDADGIVKVSAIDKKTGLSQSMKINPASGLAPEEIEEIIKEAKEYQQHDKERVELNKLKIKLKEEYNTVKQFFTSYVDKFSNMEKDEISSLLYRVENELNKDNIDAIKKLLNQLETVRLQINNILMKEFETWG